MNGIFVSFLCFCVDIDECRLEMDDCSEYASCMNNPGGFNCTCNSGFSDDNGDGRTCSGWCIEFGNLNYEPLAIHYLSLILFNCIFYYRYK